MVLILLGGWRIMFNEFYDELEKEHKDKNSMLGNRVKQFQNINNYFDNFLRINKRKFATDLFRIPLLLSLGTQILIMTLFYSYNFLDALIITLNEYSNICLNIVEHFFNSENTIPSKIFEFLNVFVEKRNLDLKTNVDPKTYYILIFSFIITLIHHIFVVLQYYAQKYLFAATFTNIFIPKIFIFKFLKRRENKTFFVRLVRNQKNKNIYTSMTDIVIRNMFLIQKEEAQKKLSLEIHPKVFLFFYDYIEIEYKEEEEKPKKQNTKDINNKIDEALDNQIELDLEKLDALNI